PTAAAFVTGDDVVVRLGSHAAPMPVCALAHIPLAGSHNVANVLAAALAAALFGAPADAIGDAVRAYRPAEHVLERVAVVDGVTFVNDTKATNEAAAIAALDAVAAPVVLIAGGKDKGVDLSAFAARSAQRARAIYLIGETAGDIARDVTAAGGPTPVLCASLEEAVRRSAEAARPGDTVLLAPACSSHDMFVDYSARGEQFREIVHKLIAERPS
ncbi:MAG: cyanophycin synthetase, partial [Armatimonadota bacterium]